MRAGSEQTGVLLKGATGTTSRARSTKTLEDSFLSRLRKARKLLTSRCLRYITTYCVYFPNMRVAMSAPIQQNGILRVVFRILKMPCRIREESGVGVVVTGRV